MTKARDRQAEAPADPGPEEIQDLDVTGDDADRVTAGDGDRPSESISINFTQVQY